MGQLKHSESVWELLRGDEENLPLEAFPKVSVVIPTKNHGAEIAFTLESLLAQDYPHLEIVIIDAHSTDRTLEIAKSFRSEKIRILSVSQYALSEMWNRGLMATKGDYLSFLEPGTTYSFSKGFTAYDAPCSGGRASIACLFLLFKESAPGRKSTDIESSRSRAFGAGHYSYFL